MSQWTFKMAAKMATKDMEYIEMPVTSLCTFLHTCMFCPTKHMRGDISTANDVCNSKMAANVATTNMKITKITITSLFNSL